MFQQVVRDGEPSQVGNLLGLGLGSGQCGAYLLPVQLLSTWKPEPVERRCAKCIEGEVPKCTPTVHGYMRSSTEQWRGHLQQSYIIKNHLPRLASWCYGLQPVAACEVKSLWTNGVFPSSLKERKPADWATAKVKWAGEYQFQLLTTVITVTSCNGISNGNLTAEMLYQVRVLFFYSFFPKLSNTKRAF